MNIQELEKALACWKGSAGAALGNGRYTSISGTIIDFYQPFISPVPILRDIVDCMDRQCRWGGHIETHYSVLAHSIWVSEAAGELAKSKVEGEGTEADRLLFVLKCRLLGLCHDLEEGICQDIISPVKYSLGPRYCRLAEQWKERLFKKFEIGELVQYRDIGDEAGTSEVQHVVGLADLWALSFEDDLFRKNNLNKLIGCSVGEYPEVTTRPDFFKKCNPNTWLRMFEELTGAIKSMEFAICESDKGNE
jgi:5'-deoxynucleotidase YfbR-like HD superfamily hydrolase